MKVAPIYSQLIVERANRFNNGGFLLSIGDNSYCSFGGVRKAEASKKADRFISRRPETQRDNKQKEIFGCANEKA